MNHVPKTVFKVRAGQTKVFKRITHFLENLVFGIELKHIRFSELL